MRIAFCISGQPRTWRKCYHTWYSLFGPYGKIDTFFHMWDFNSEPRYLAEFVDGEPKETPIEEREKREIVAALKPRAFVFEKKRPVHHECPNGPTIAPYAHSQYYGVWRAAHLKRQYEIDRNFQYDVVVRLRTDLLLPMSWVNPPNFEQLPPNTVFTAQNTFTPGPGHRVNDMFFYADSLTYDHAASFYVGLSYINETVAAPGLKEYPPELAIYFYLASIGIVNTPMPIYDFKIMRDAEFIKKVGQIQDYETV